MLFTQWCKIHFMILGDYFYCVKMAKIRFLNFTFKKMMLHKLFVTGIILLLHITIFLIKHTYEIVGS